MVQLQIIVVDEVRLKNKKHAFQNQNQKRNLTYPGCAYA